MDEHTRELLFDLFNALPQQGPGDTASTQRAYETVAGRLNGLVPRGDTLRALDIGCGSGAQTFNLAAVFPGHITATDINDRALALLTEEAARRGLSARITVVHADMSALPYEAGSFELLWAESSVFVITVAEALRMWRRLIAPGGVLVLSDLVWYSERPPHEAKAFWQLEYATMTSTAGFLALAEAHDYDVLSHFGVSNTTMLGFYHMLEQALPAFEARHAHDDTARAVTAMTRTEIDIQRRFGEHYGYEFFVLTPR